MAHPEDPIPEDLRYEKTPPEEDQQIHHNEKTLKPKPKEIPVDGATSNVPKQPGRKMPSRQNHWAEDTMESLRSLRKMNERNREGRLPFLL